MSLLKLEIESGKETFKGEKEKIIREKDERIARLVEENVYYQQLIKDLRTTNIEVTKAFQQLAESKGGKGFVEVDVPSETAAVTSKESNSVQKDRSRR